ncbi:hypothetical protein PSD17_06570 [Pseudonocardia sp. D17]|nr:hypothetical protein PSD17_06570 [Pseudonocardia sp. D17]
MLTRTYPITRSGSDASLWVLAVRVALRNAFGFAGRGVVVLPAVAGFLVGVVIGPLLKVGP